MVTQGEVMKLVRVLERNGWHCERGKHQHIKCRSPCGKKQVVIASTPSQSGFSKDRKRVLAALAEGK